MNIQGDKSRDQKVFDRKNRKNRNLLSKMITKNTLKIWQLHHRRRRHRRAPRSVTVGNRGTDPDRRFSNRNHQPRRKPISKAKRSEKAKKHSISSEKKRRRLGQKHRMVKKWRLGKKQRRLEVQLARPQIRQALGCWKILRKRGM